MIDDWQIDISSYWVIHYYIDDYRHWYLWILENSIKSLMTTFKINRTIQILHHQYRNGFVENKMNFIFEKSKTFLQKTIFLRRLPILI